MIGAIISMIGAIISMIGTIISMIGTIIIKDHRDDELKEHKMGHNQLLDCLLYVTD